MQITRQKSGKHFDYYKNGTKITDQSEIDRINALVIPPAWTDVQISASKSAKIQAKGIDNAGRTQAIYHPTFRIKQDKLKYEKILRFAEKLPKLRKQIKKDLARKRLNEPKVVACIVKLIDEQFFRVGSEQYAKENQTYGITTLRSKHANITTTSVTFDFVGKSGKQHVKKITDPQIARIIQQLDDMPGYEIFRYLDSDGKLHDIHSNNVNKYIKRYMGDEFTAKDFRTWGGTLLAVSALLAEDHSEARTKTATTKTIQKVVKQVAKRLGNTPAVAKSSYIDPRVFTVFEDGVSIPKLQKTMANMRPKKYMTVEEQCVLKVLND